MPRYYENKYPDVSCACPAIAMRSSADCLKVDQLVMVQVLSIEEMGAYVKLVR